MDKDAVFPGSRASLKGFSPGTANSEILQMRCMFWWMAPVVACAILILDRRCRQLLCWNVVEASNIHAYKSTAHLFEVSSCERIDATY